MKKDNTEEEVITLEQMLERPTSATALEEWLDDRYVTYKTDKYDELTEKYKKEGTFYKKPAACICISLAYGDWTGTCSCGRIKREIRPEKDFIRIRRKRFKCSKPIEDEDDENENEDSVVEDTEDIED